ncbi:hypothetical protein GEMRC1_011290 [Eukaryota sp. GEM-RC1]
MHLRIDPFRYTQLEIRDKVMKHIVSLIPMRKSRIVEATIFLPHSVLGTLFLMFLTIGKCLSIIHQYCTIDTETFSDNGCELVVTLNPGDYDQLNGDLVNASKGKVSVTVNTLEPFAELVRYEKQCREQQ